MPRHPDDVDLTWEQVRDAIRALEGARVSVRLVERGDPEMLLAVFEGTLGALSRAKDPTLFWPCGSPAITSPPRRRTPRSISAPTATMSRTSASTCARIASRAGLGAQGAACWWSSRALCSSTSVGRSRGLSALAQTVADGHELAIEPRGAVSARPHGVGAASPRAQRDRPLRRSTYRRVVSIDERPGRALGDTGRCARCSTPVGALAGRPDRRAHPRPPRTAHWTGSSG